MRLKNLTFLFLLFFISNIDTNAQNNIKETLKDTISYSEENTEKIIEFGQLIEASIHENDADTSA